MNVQSRQEIRKRSNII